MTWGRIAAVAVVVVLFCPSLTRAGSTPVEKDLAFETSGVLRETIHANRSWGARNTAADGAYSSVNIAWDQSHVGRWYIEQQRDGFDMIAIGLAFRDPEVVDRGVRALEWGFRQQNPDGSFSCDDAFHSTSFFVEAAAHSVLILRADPMGAQFAPRMDALLDGLRRATQWMTRADVEAAGRARNRPFTHRRFLVGAALGESAVVLNDAALRGKSEEYIREGLALQEIDGVNPEKGGHDSNYQAVGLSYALRYYRLVADARLQSEMRGALDKGVRWLARRVDQNGDVSSEGNTRSGGEEKNRDGTPKGVNYTWVVRTFADWALISGDEGDEALARRVWGRWLVVKPA
jgi:hypothetical protein